MFKWPAVSCRQVISGTEPSAYELFGEAKHIESCQAQRGKGEWVR